MLIYSFFMVSIIMMKMTVGKRSPKARPVFKLSPNSEAALPTKVGPTVQPMSPKRARKEKRAVLL